MPTIIANMPQQEWEKLQRDLAAIPNAIPRVASRAINKVAQSARSEVTKAVSAKIMLTQTELRNRNITLTQASWGNLQAEIKISGKRVPMGHFAMRPAQPNPKAQRRLPGSSYQIQRGGGRIVAEHAFTVRMKSGHMGIFRRKPGAAWTLRKQDGQRTMLPIVELHGPSVPVVFSDLPEFAQETYEQMLAAKLDAEISTQVAVLIGQQR